MEPQVPFECIETILNWTIFGPIGSMVNQPMDLMKDHLSYQGIMMDIQGVHHDSPPWVCKDSHGCSVGEVEPILVASSCGDDQSPISFVVSCLSSVLPNEGLSKPAVCLVQGNLCFINVNHVTFGHISYPQRIVLCPVSLQNWWSEGFISSRWNLLPDYLTAVVEAWRGAKTTKREIQEGNFLAVLEVGCILMKILSKSRSSFLNSNPLIYGASEGLGVPMHL